MVASISPSDSISCARPDVFGLLIWRGEVEGLEPPLQSFMMLSRLVCDDDGDTLASVPSESSCNAGSDDANFFKWDLYCRAAPEIYFCSCLICRSRTPCCRKKDAAFPLPPKDIICSCSGVHSSSSTDLSNN